jgi:hypothetical protein
MAPQLILYRIIGNDLLLDQAGQEETIHAVRFLLDHEPALPGLEKRWLFNRIASPATGNRLRNLIEAAGQRVDQLVFDEQRFMRLSGDYSRPPAEALALFATPFKTTQGENEVQLSSIVRHRLRYLFNHHLARNHAIFLGLAAAEWVLICDGPVYLQEPAWQRLRQLSCLDDLQHISVPVLEVHQHHHLLVPLHQLACNQRQPQMCFSRRSSLRFGRSSSSLSSNGSASLSRNGLHSWPFPCVEEEHRNPLRQGSAPATVPAQADRVASSVHGSWLLALAPAVSADCPQSNGSGPSLSPAQFSLSVERSLLQNHTQRSSRLCWRGLDQSDSRLAQGRFAGLFALVAELTPCVQSMPPPRLSGLQPIAGASACNDYRQTVPPWQTESAADALLCRYRCRNVAELADTLARPTGHDRLELQRLIHGLSILSLDLLVRPNELSTLKVRALIHAWFVAPETRMEPNGLFAQVVTGMQMATTLIAATSFRDFFVLLEALRLLLDLQVLHSGDVDALMVWFADFLGWLTDDRPALFSNAVASHIQTYHSLLVLACSLFLERFDMAALYIDQLPTLRACQFHSDGSPRQTVWLVPGPHGRLLNLQAWANIAVLTSPLQLNLLSKNGHKGCVLENVFERLNHDLHHLYAHAFCDDVAVWMMIIKSMFGPLAHEWSAPVTGQPRNLPILTHPSTGIPPFWPLCCE